MSDHVYKKIELTGSSPDGIDQAINAAVSRASETLHDLRWFELTEVRGDIDGGKVVHWQASIKVGFTLADNPEA